MGVFGVTVIHLTLLNFFYFYFVSVYLEGLYCSAYDLISSEIKQSKLLSLLIVEIKDKQLVSSCLLSGFYTQNQKQCSVNDLKVESFNAVYAELHSSILTF